jgi:hypothetical protein
LLGWYVAAVAEKNGIPPDAIPPEFAEAVVAAVLEVEADTAHNTPVEKALHLAARGDFEKAGHIARGFMLDSAHEMAAVRLLEQLSGEVERMKPDANLGRRRRQQFADFARTHADELSEERKKEWDRWRKEAARLLKLNPHLGLPGKKSELARKVKASLHLPDSLRTIRHRL